MAQGLVTYDTRLVFFIRSSFCASLVCSPYDISAQARGVYNKCLCDSDLQRDRVGYTDTEQKTPALIFVVGLLSVAVAGVLGIQGNNHVTTGLDAMFTSKSM